MKEIKGRPTLRDMTELLNYKTIMYNKMHDRDYTGIEFDIINGVYPLFRRDDPNNPLWQYTTLKNSTGKSFEDARPVLKHISNFLDRDYLESEAFEFVEISTEQKYHFERAHKALTKRIKRGSRVFHQEYYDALMSIVTPRTTRTKIYEMFMSLGFDCLGLLDRGFAKDFDSLTPEQIDFYRAVLIETKDLNIQ